MALIVEDGTGLDDADSYVSIAEVDDYNLRYLNDYDWDLASTAQKERALRVATEYIDSIYGHRFSGYRLTNTQALAWPRYAAYRFDNTPILEALPITLRNAVCIVAIELMHDIQLYGDVDSSNPLRAYSFKAGPVEEHFEYAASTRVDPYIGKVERMLFDLLGATGNRLERA